MYILAFHSDKLSIKQTFHKLNAFPMKGKILLKKKTGWNTTGVWMCHLDQYSFGIQKDLQPQMKDSV